MFPIAFSIWDRVVDAVAKSESWESFKVVDDPEESNPEEEYLYYNTSWMLVTKGTQVVDYFDTYQIEYEEVPEDENPPIWTDDFASINSVLRDEDWGEWIEENKGEVADLWLQVKEKLGFEVESEDVFDDETEVEDEEE